MKVDKIDWYDLLTTYAISKKRSNGRLWLKITSKHMNQNTFEKMLVKYTVQFFSRTMSAPNSTAQAIGELQSTSAVHTAYYFGGK